MRTLLSFLLLFAAASAHAQNVIYAYAIGDWRNGPVVTISPLFETTEAFTDLQLIARVKNDHPEFATITDIDVQRFATTEEGDLSRTTLKAKYEARKLEVKMLDEMPPANPPPGPTIHFTPR